MKPSKQFVRGWGFAALMVLLVLLGSCKYDLVKEPTHNFNEKKNAADYKDYILPPSVVTASHGLSRIVNLEWESVPNAVQYYIYSAATPYDVFQKVSETKGAETEISIDEETGITKYYCVCAVNYYGTVSSKSIVVSGSTLAVPIITEITASEEGTCVTVNWWMDNCNKETYENIVSYNISVYKNVSSNVKVKQPVTVNGNIRSVVIDQLESKTEYFFTIEVVNEETGDKEISSKTSALTAHRVIPDPPENVQVSKGDSVSKITVSWQLPDEVWYRTNEGSSGFELHPVFFKIYRKDDSQNFTLLSQQKYTDTYKPGVIVSYEDTNVERGKQYEYFIQSFTDNIPAGKEITADSSKSQSVTGWLVSTPKFYIESNYTKSEDEQSFTNITFNPKLSFEAYGIEYKYVIGVKKVALDSDDEEQLPVKEFNSVSVVNDYIDSFDNPADAQGYYYYTLYIYPAEGDEYFVAADASGKYTVTSDVNAIPVINDFVLNDGFSQKFELSWKYNPDYVYTVHWKDGENGEEQAEEIDSSYFAGKTKDETVTYSHAAASGDCRIYTLEASCGISTTVRPNGDTSEVLYKTLGTPDIKIVSYDFDRIKVEWNAVQKASETYTVSAHYENENTELVPEGNRTITENTDVVSFEISQPDGYDDATISGKPIILSVTASSETQSDSTTGSKNVCTLGPALTNTTVSQIEENIIKNAISIEWNAVQGAQGYLIKRICYKKGKTNIEAGSSEIDTYYFDGTNLSVTSEPVDSSRAYVTPTEEGFVLTDIAKEPQDITKQYEINQSRISWGVPYDYFIIPVKADGLAPAINYVNIPHNYIATYGYGLNIKAEKSDSSTTQVLEWDPPYITQDNLPSFYYREAGSTLNKWLKITSATVDSSNTMVTFKPASQTMAYEYLVAYNKAFDYVDVPVSFLNDTDVGLAAKESRTEYNYANEASVENANKGYLLAVNFSAGTGNNYEEKVTWSAWDYQNRKIGPESAELYIKNYNISEEWKKFAELNENLQYSDKEELENTAITKIDNVTVSLEPVQKMDKNNKLVVTPGYMQVLRDAKHYYKLDLTRGEVTCSVGIDENNNETVYAYRNITDYEFAKIVMLVMNDGLDRIGSLDFENKSKSDGSSGGSVSFTHKSFMNLGTEYTYEYENYSPVITMPFGNAKGCVSISCSGKCERDQLGVGGYPKKFSQVTITATKKYIDMPASYSGQITFSLSSSSSASITSKGQSVSMDNIRAYIPFKIHDDETSYINNSALGWWPDEN